jgi:hypothetical protein
VTEEKYISSKFEFSSSEEALILAKGLYIFKKRLKSDSKKFYLKEPEIPTYT